MNALRHPRALPTFRNILFYLLIAILLSIAVYYSTADSVTNPSASQPIEVDGTTTPGEYSSSQPTGFISGSLYQTKGGDPKATSIYTAVNGFVVGDRNAKQIGKVESKDVTSVGVAGSKFADITLPVTFNNAPTWALLQVTIGANGAFLYSATIDDDGVIDSNPLTADVAGTSYAPSRLGMNLAASIASTAFAQQPHAVVEFAISSKARATFRSGQVVANFFKANGDLVQVVDAYVEVDAGANTNTNTDHLPLLAEIDMASAIDLQKQGNVPVTVETTDFFDAQTINLLSVKLYPSEAAAAAYPDGGAAPANAEEVLKPNGQRDLRLFFTTQALTAAGFASGSTTDVVLVAKTSGTPAITVIGFTTVKTVP